MAGYLQHRGRCHNWSTGLYFYVPSLYQGLSPWRGVGPAPRVFFHHPEVALRLRGHSLLLRREAPGSVGILRVICMHLFFMALTLRPSPLW